MRFQAPRGTADVLPSESEKWLKVESTFRSVTRLYGYSEIRTPTFEDTEIFVRTAGETSDIVTKEMYTFRDKGDRSLTLKPEGTAPAMRALLEHNLCPPGTVARLSYITPFFRYERPQKGRFREAHQAGLELVGSTSAEADAEIIEITIRFYKELGISETFAKLNSIGRGECRQRFRDAILSAASTFLADSSTEFQERVQKNPLRLLDSKDPAAQETIRSIPPITDFLEDDSKARFERIQELLAESGTAFELAPEIVRGLDYYTDTVFEVHSAKLGAQSALCGGGRYDGLIQELGGPPTPSVGVGMGIERLMIVMDESQLWNPPAVPAVFVVQATEAAGQVCRLLTRRLRDAGLVTLRDLDGKSMKSQLRQANSSGATYAMIIGDDELAKNSVQVKVLGASEQFEIPFDEVVMQVTGKR